MRRFLLWAWVLVGCARAPLLTAQRPTDRPTVFSQVRVFDGKSNVLSPPVDVLVSGGKVSAIAPAISRPEGAEVVEGRGGVLMPGLFDAHVHLGGTEGAPLWEAGKHLPEVEPQAAALLYSGVTTAVLASRDTDSRELAAEIAGNRVAGPRLLRSTRILTAVGGHPVPMYKTAVPGPVGDFVVRRSIAQVSGADAARAAVREELEDDSGLHHVKVVYHALPPKTPRLSLEELTAIIAQAKALGRPVVAHVGTAAGAVEAAEAGVSLLMHVPWEDRLTVAQAQAIAARQVAVVTTRRIFSAVQKSMSADAAFTSLEKEVMGEQMQGWYARRPEHLELGVFEDLTALMPEYDANIGANILTLAQAGVKLIAGTDTGIPAIFPGAGLHEELKALVALGLPPARVLAMATSLAAQVVDPDGGRGLVEVGAVADLLLVRGDPLSDIGALSQIAGVWLKGERKR